MRTAKRQSLDLSKRKKEILEWIQRGKTSWEIGIVLGIKECTVKAHIAEIFEQLDVTKRSQAVSMAIALGYLSPIVNTRSIESSFDEKDPRLSIYACCYFMDQLERESQRAARYGRCFSLLVMDALPLSKNGIAEKETLLERIAVVLKNNIRSIDIVGRTDGGKLAILAPELKKVNAIAFADKLVKIWGGNAGLKVGVVTCPDDGSSPEELIRMAESLFCTVRIKEESIYAY